MPGRGITSSIGYRYGFGGQEKDDEVSGNGNSYTAEFWQYDSRLGKRWNIDPVFRAWESPYATFHNNPIYFNDPLGLDPEQRFSVMKRFWNRISGSGYKNEANQYAVEHNIDESKVNYNYNGYNEAVVDESYYKTYEVLMEDGVSHMAEATYYENRTVFDRNGSHKIGSVSSFSSPYSTSPSDYASTKISEPLMKFSFGFQATVDAEALGFGADLDFRPCYWETGSSGTQYSMGAKGTIFGAGAEVSREETLFPGYYDADSDDWGKKWVRETVFNYVQVGLNKQGAEDIYIYIQNATTSEVHKMHVSHRVVSKSSTSVGAAAIIGIEVGHVKEYKGANKIK